MAQQKKPPEKIERFIHEISYDSDSYRKSISGELYPDVVEFLPLVRKNEYIKDPDNPIKATMQSYVQANDGTRIGTDLPLPLVEWIVESSHIAEHMLKRQTAPDGHRGRLIGHIVIPINPTTKKNNQRFIKNKFGRIIPIPSAMYTQYLTDIKKLGNTIWKSPPSMLLPLDRPLSISAHYYRKDRHLCDITNLESALMDILVEIRILKNDNYTIVCNTDGSRVFVDRDFPHTEVFIYAWDT